MASTVTRSIMAVGLVATTQQYRAFLDGNNNRWNQLRTGNRHKPRRAADVRIGKFYSPGCRPSQTVFHSLS